MLKIKLLIKDLFTGWPDTFLKWSVQLSTIEGPIMGFLYASAGLFDPWVLPTAYVLFWLASLAASNLTQKNIGSYDKTKYRLVPIDEVPNAPIYPKDT